MDPQQELFTRLKIKLEEYGYSVYDGFLPPENTPYPFVYLGESTLTDEPNKTAIFGRVTQKVDVWHNDIEKRGTLSAIMLNVKRAARSMEKNEDGFKWLLVNTTQRILPDKTTARPLLHGILEFEYKFS